MIQIKYLSSNWEIHDASYNYITLNDAEDNYFVIINIGKKTVSIEQVGKCKLDCDYTEEEREYKGNFIGTVLYLVFMGGSMSELGSTFGSALFLVFGGVVISALFLVIKLLG